MRPSVRPSATQALWESGERHVAHGCTLDVHCEKSVYQSRVRQTDRLETGSRQRFYLCFPDLSRYQSSVKLNLTFLHWHGASPYLLLSQVIQIYVQIRGVLV